MLGYLPPTGAFSKKNVKKVVTLQPFWDFFFCILFGGNKKFSIFASGKGSNNKLFLPFTQMLIN